MTTFISEREREGTFARKWHTLFGYRDQTEQELKAIEGHGAWKYRLARFISFFLLIAFSIGALVTLAAESTQQVIAEYEQGGVQAVNWIEAGTTFTVFIFVLAMDTSILIGAAKLRDGMTRGLDIITDMLGTTALVVYLSLIEAATYVAMTVRYEHPRDWFQWLLIIARGTAIPIVAIYLSLVDQTPIGRRDIQRLIQRRTGKQLLNFVDSRLKVADNPEASWGLFATSNGATPEEAEWDAKIQAHMAQLAPEKKALEMAEQRAALEREKAELDRRAEQVFADAERRLAEAEQQLQMARGTQVGALDRAKEWARSELDRALMVLALTGELPADLQIDGIDLEALKARLQNAKGGAGRRQRTAKQDTSRRGRIIEFLASLDIDPAKTPEGKRDIWIASSAFARLCEGGLSADVAREIARKHGEGLKQGTSYVAPFGKVMAELSARKALSEVASTFWASLTQEGDNGEGLSGASFGDSGEYPAVRSADSDEEEAHVVLPFGHARAS